LSDAARTTLLSTPIESDIEEGARRNRFIMGMGGMGGGGGGILQVLLAQLSGLKKPRGFLSIGSFSARRALWVPQSMVWRSTVIPISPTCA